MEILRQPDGPDRTAALVAWVQQLSGREEDVPVLVGGAAVGLYSGGAYTTGDLDLVGPVTVDLERGLAAAGFRREGRHWIHEEAQVFLEFPGRSLAPDERALWVVLRGQRLRVISLEDLLVDRLGAWQYWESSVDGVNALLLWRVAGGGMDVDRLERRVHEEGWDRALASLRSFARRWREGDPPAEEVERWANSGP